MISQTIKVDFLAMLVDCPWVFQRIREPASAGKGQRMAMQRLVGHTDCRPQAEAVQRLHRFAGLAGVVGKFGGPVGIRCSSQPSTPSAQGTQAWLAWRRACKRGRSRSEEPC